MCVLIGNFDKYLLKVLVLQLESMQYKTYEKSWGIVLGKTQFDFYSPPRKEKVREKGEDTKKPQTKPKNPVLLAPGSGSF